MKFHKITWDEENPYYTYQSVTGASFTIRPGDVSHDGHIITKDDIHILINEYNREVYNNVKNCKANLTEQQKQQMKEWEEEHPGEKYPYKWNASLEYERDEKSNSDLLQYTYHERTTGDNPAVDMFWEVIGQMTDKQRRAYVLSRFHDLSNLQIAKIMDIKPAAVSRLISRAEDFIRKNYKM